MIKTFDKNEIVISSEYELPRIVSQYLTADVLSGCDGTLSPTDAAAQIMTRIHDFKYIFIFLRLDSYTLEMNDEEPFSFNMKLKLNEATELMYQLIVRENNAVICDVSGYRSILMELDKHHWETIKAKQTTLLDSLNELREQVVAWCGDSVRVVVSELGTGCNSIPKTFHLTLFAVDMIFEIYRDQYIITLDSLNKLPSAQSVHTPRKERETIYLESILDYNFSKAKAILYDMIEDELKDPLIAVNIRVRIQNRILMAIGAVDVPMNSSSPVCQEIYRVLRQIISAKTVGEVYSFVDSIFSNLSSFYNKSTISTKTKIEMIINYIKTNYSDPSLSVAKISDDFDISYAYLSREFKNETGIRLIDFIHHARIDAAKQLLPGDSSIAEIAHAVGYYNDTSFIRAFKRFEGISPGLFRKSLRTNRPLS